MFSWLKKKSRSGGQGHIERTSRGGLSASAPDLTEEEVPRQTVQLEKVCNHGFPISPSCMEYDHQHKLLLIGTSTGELRVLGRPGVELSGFHDEVNRVLQILPVVDEPSFLTICSGNMIHRWSYFSEQGHSDLVLERSYKLAGGSPKSITTACLPPHSDSVFVGTLGGITYPIDVHLYGMSPEIIAPSRARERLHYHSDSGAGAVQCIELNPVQKRQLLIGHEENYFELWDVFSTKPLKIICPTKEVGGLSSMSWHFSGQRFMTGHKDGSVLEFSLESEPGEEGNHLVAEKTFYDAKERRDVGNILWPSDSMVVFSGGVPLDASDSDCVTICDGPDQACLQLSSGIRAVRVIEGQVVDKDSGMIDVAGDNESSVCGRRILILLLEQEVLFLDLTLPDLPLLLPPYLHSLHNSPVKSQVVYSDLRPEVWQLIEKAGTLQTSLIYPGHIKSWPIDGGHTDNFTSRHRRDLLLTGHEDGSVKFWDISQVYFRLIYVLRSASYFDLEQDRPASPNEGLPHARSVGFWDPRGDDGRLMVTSVCLDGWSLSVGYNGGQVLVFKLNNQKSKHTIKSMRVTLMKEYMSLHPSLWSDPLAPRGAELEHEPGYQPSHCLQLLPTSAVTTQALMSDNQILAVGSYYGFAVVDLVQDVCSLAHSTYDPDQPDMAGASRMQSVRKSFRQSLRRFNLRRSLRASQSARRTLRPGQLQRGTSSRGTSLPASARLGTTAAPKRDAIRFMAFTPPVQAHGHFPLPTLWVGTGLGTVLSYYVEMPSDSERDLKAVSIQPLDKEYGKKKQFATLFVGLLDGGTMLGDRTQLNASKYRHKPTGHIHGGGHHQYVVVCTEEELRVLSLHSAKRKHKIKLKLNEEDGYHMVSAHYIRVNDQPVLMVMDTEGYIHVFSLPDLKPLYKAWCLDGADAVGQRSFISTPTGLVLHMRSPSEFARLSLTEEARSGLKFCSLTRSLQLQVTGLRKNVETPLSHTSETDQEPLEGERAL